MLGRAKEFFIQGYNVVVYGFSRNDIPVSGYDFPITDLGRMPRKQYLYRILFMYRAIRKIRKDIHPESLLYCIGQDMCMITKMIFHKEYIYEECDLSFSYINNKLIQSFLHHIDKRMIMKSLLTVLTSQGFCKYHFGDTKPSNVWILSNRLDPTCRDYPFNKKDRLPDERIRIGFVGKIRFGATYRLLKHLSEYSDYSLHFYGIEQWFSKADEQAFHDLCDEGKVICHGRFKSPDDLSSIYSELDLTVATYDIDSLNPKWAEPNKLYESIYYETPIIVSSDCYLADVVNGLNIGYTVDTSNTDDLNILVDRITSDSIEEKRLSCRSVGKDFCLNDNTDFFEAIRKLKR